MAHAFIHLTNGFVPNPDIRLRLAIVGAPGSGKSTLAAGLLYFSKLFFFRSDAVPEVAKWHYYKGTDFSAPDFEMKKFNEQKELEEIYPDKLNILICEAPLIMSAIYSSFYLGDDSPVSREMFKLADEYKDRYTHFILSRKLVKFEEFGRNENQEQADRLHHTTVNILERLNLNYIVVNRYDEHIPLQILSMVGAVSPEGQRAQLGRRQLSHEPQLDV